MVRKHFVKMRMNEIELETLTTLYKKTTERALSNYLRKVVLQKPVVIKFRNESADEFLNEMLQLKKELNAIGNNFNQAVKKLHLLDKIPEFRFWITQHYNLHTELLNKIEHIKLRMNQCYEKWSQE